MIILVVLSLIFLLSVIILLSLTLKSNSNVEVILKVDFKHIEFQAKKNN